MHRPLLDAMRVQPAFSQLLARLPTPGGDVRVASLPASAPALMLAALADARPGRLWIAVTRAPADAEAFEADLQALLGEDAAVLFPQRETLPYEAAEHHVEVSGLRVEALEAVLSARARILVT